MKRLMTFALIGPPVGAFALIFIVIPLQAILDDAKIEFGLVQVQTFLALIPLSYVVGIIPAILAALADGAVRNLRMPLRILCVTAAGVPVWVSAVVVAAQGRWKKLGMGLWTHWGGRSGNLLLVDRQLAATCRDRNSIITSAAAGRKRPDMMPGRPSLMLEAQRSS